jgi:hypothetical protein
VIGSEELTCVDDGEGGYQWDEEVPSCHVTVTCRVVVDNDLHAIFVDGREVAATPTAAYNDYYAAKVFKFQGDAKVVAVSASEGEGGCRYGAFAFHCTGPGSKWHDFMCEAGDSKSCKVLGSVDQNTLSGNDIAWTKLDFDDSRWASAVATRNACTRKEMPECNPAEAKEFPVAWCPEGCSGLDADDQVPGVCADEEAAINEHPGYDSRFRYFWWVRMSP